MKNEEKSEDAGCLQAAGTSENLLTETNEVDKHPPGGAPLLMGKHERSNSVAGSGSARAGGATGGHNSAETKIGMSTGGLGVMGGATAEFGRGITATEQMLRSTSCKDGDVVNVLGVQEGIRP